MKTSITFYLIILSLQTLAQDIIIKSDGSEIKALVEEITYDFIKYKNFDQPEGPIRNIALIDVFMIIYKNGSREIIKNPEKNLDSRLLKNDSTVQNETKDHYKQDSLIKSTNINTKTAPVEFIDLQLQKAQSIRKAGDVLLGISSLTCLTGLILANTKNEKVAIPFAIACGTTFITGLILELSGRSKYKYWSRKRAEISFFLDPSLILNYNKYPQSVSSSLLLGVQINF